MPSLSEQLIQTDRRIEQLKLQVEQQYALIDCLKREHYDVTRERRALDDMLAELSLMLRYQQSLYQEAAFVGERGKKAS
jgi:hypothetical protein